jgi:phage-related protein
MRGATTVTGRNGLKELRVKLGTDICRLFYFHFNNGIYVITSGYQKKDAKTDPREIERALRLMNEYKHGGYKNENV